MDNQEQNAGLDIAAGEDRSAFIVHTIKDGKSVACQYFINYEARQMHQDWFNLSREAFYEKYPGSKPVYPEPRVTLDEADKGPDGRRIRR